MSLASSWRHGLVVQHVLNKLRRSGLKIDLFWLVREGEQEIETSFPPDYSVALLERDAAAQVEALTEWNTLEEINRRMDAGHTCLVLRHHDSVVGYTWANLEEVKDLADEYKLKQGEVYLYDAYVDPAHRGDGLASRLRNSCYNLMRKQGFSSFVSISDRFNLPSLKFKRRLGGRPEALYLGLQLGRFRIGQLCLRSYANVPKVWQAAP